VTPFGSRRPGGRRQRPQCLRRRATAATAGSHGRPFSVVEYSFGRKWTAAAARRIDHSCPPKASAPASDASERGGRGPIPQSISRRLFHSHGLFAYRAANSNQGKRRTQSAPLARRASLQAPSARCCRGCVHVGGMRQDYRRSGAGSAPALGRASARPASATEIIWPLRSGDRRRRSREPALVRSRSLPLSTACEPIGASPGASGVPQSTSHAPCEGALAVMSELDVHLKQGSLRRACQMDLRSGLAQALDCSLDR
jgi:hypothetical protein